MYDTLGVVLAGAPETGSRLASPIESTRRQSAQSRSTREVEQGPLFSGKGDGRRRPASQGWSPRFKVAFDKSSLKSSSAPASTFFTAPNLAHLGLYSSHHVDTLPEFACSYGARRCFMSPACFFAFLLTKIFAFTRSSAHQFVFAAHCLACLLFPGEKTAV